MKRTGIAWGWGAGLLLFAAMAARAEAPAAFLASLAGGACATPALASVLTGPVAPGLTPAAQPDACTLPCTIAGVCQSCGNGTSKPCTITRCCGLTTTRCGACTTNCVPPPD